MEGIRQYKAYGVPASQLVIGLPWYGYGASHDLQPGSRQMHAQGDLMLLDNTLTAHGGNSWTGPRDILVSLFG